METQNISEEENLVMNGKVNALDWLLCKENSCSAREPSDRE
jgi:hypothetical protein